MGPTIILKAPTKKFLHCPAFTDTSSATKNPLTAIIGHFGHSHDHDGHPDGRGQHPDEHVDHLGLNGSAKLQRPDRVAHGDVAVHAHHGEGEDAGEHVVIIDGDNQLAQDLPERPRVHQVLGALEGQRAGRQGVGESQVEDVDVGGRLHLGVSGCKHTAGVKLIVNYPALEMNSELHSLKYV